MKTQLENIIPKTDSSFRWLIHPKLNDFFFWHFHPEYELVLIEATEGTRHVGEHISRYHGGDLVLIGSNIPHLNFDYGLKTEYQKIVLHIQPHFLGNAFEHTPELSKIGVLFEKAQMGIAFGENTRHRIAPIFKKIYQLSYFEQLVEVLKVFQLLSEAEDITLLHAEIPKNIANKREQERLKKLHDFVAEHYQRKIEIDEVAQLCHLSNAAFCRYFKKLTRLTFTEFLNHYRVNQAKKMLLRDKNVSEACFECGFESLSYFNRTFKKITNENPLSFKKRYF